MNRICFKQITYLWKSYVRFFSSFSDNTLVISRLGPPTRLPIEPDCIWDTKDVNVRIYSFMCERSGAATRLDVSSTRSIDSENWFDYQIKPRYSYKYLSLLCRLYRVMLCYEFYLDLYYNFYRYILVSFT